MLGFRVTNIDGSDDTVEADSYHVTDSGHLRVDRDGTQIAFWPAGDWLAIDDVGVPLSPTWPSPKLDDLLGALGSILAVKYGNMLYTFATAGELRSGVFNEVDSLATAVLTSVGIDITSTDRHPEISEVREAIAKAFGVDVPKGRPLPTAVITDITCPLCGRALHHSGEYLRCEFRQVDFSPQLSNQLFEFCRTPPSPHAESATSALQGSNYFCPHDGRILQIGAFPICPRCGRGLSDRILFELDKIGGLHGAI